MWSHKHGYENFYSKSAGSLTNANHTISDLLGYMN